MTAIPAIPTLYKGVRFRSRLEARWAAFFDNVGWQWDYEPIDLEGYIPDFVMRFHEPLLIEIKPAFVKDDFLDARHKIEQSGWGGEALITYAAPQSARVGTGTTIGYLRHGPGWYGDDVGPWEIGFLFFCRNCKRLGVAASEGSFGCRVCGTPGGSDHHLDCEKGAILVEAAWAKACNDTQWRGADR
jgi:hypothetical protein